MIDIKISLHYQLQLILIILIILSFINELLPLIFSVILNNKHITKSKIIVGAEGWCD